MLLCFFSNTKYEFDCSFVYGNPIFQQRKGLWSMLLELQMHNGRQWCCIGDFNEILTHYEKDGIRPFDPRRAELFRDFLNLSRLIDMELKGCAYTWISNPRNGIIIREKLDRVLANWSWRHDHPNAIPIALPIVSSTHDPILFLPYPKEKSGVSFNFELFWVEHVECFGVVEMSVKRT